MINNSIAQIYIDWINVIILNEFNRYLNNDSLVELSLVSKILRKKLSPKLFNSVKFTDSDFSSDISYFGLRPDCRQNKFSNEILQKFNSSESFLNYSNKREYKDLVVDPYLESYKGKFEPYSKYVKALTLYALKEPLYYLVDLVRLATNLNSLYIDTGFMLLKEFQTVLDGLKNLKSLKINNVTFVAFKTGKLCIEDISPPKSLKSLILHDTKLITRRYKKGAYQLLFEKFCIDPEPLIIALDHLPGLEYLEYKTEFYTGNFIGKFLRINPQIKKLGVSLTTLILDLTDKDYFSANRTISLISSNDSLALSNNALYTKLKNITAFEYSTSQSIQPDTFSRIFSSLENLRYLTINLDQYNSNINALETVICNLRLLKVIWLKTNSSALEICSHTSQNHYPKVINYRIYNLVGKLMLNSPENLVIAVAIDELNQSHKEHAKRLTEIYEGWSTFELSNIIAFHNSSDSRPINLDFTNN